MDFFDTYIQQSIVSFANWIWGIPLLILLLGGGISLAIYSRLQYLRLLPEAFSTLFGKNNKDQAGYISPFKALSTAMASTIGMGNIAGISVAVTIGGPGAIFWMWVTTILGMGIEFFANTLSVMYRTEIDGKMQAGPMYIIVNGLGKRWKPMAILFALACMIGALPIFQANQLTESVQSMILNPMGIDTNFYSNLIIGIVVVILVSLVILGGLKSISNTAGLVVPIMVVFYFLSVLIIVFSNFNVSVHNFLLIFTDAFSASFYKGEKVFGSALGGLIILGARRASFSNEAGLGTATIVHGMSKINSPIKQGIVSMLGPMIDTIIVCTLTGLAILSTDLWHTDDVKGVNMVISVFDQSLPVFGGYAIFICVFCFSITTIFTYAYMGAESFGFLCGIKRKHYYHYFYILSILLGSVSSLRFIISIVDSAYAIMAIPTVTATLILSPKVIKLLKKHQSKK